MLKKFSIPVFLCVLISLVGCDQGQKMMKPVLTPEPTHAKDEPPPPETDAQETVYPEVTHANALKLKLSETYRMRPSGYFEVENGFGESTIWYIYWGNVDNRGRLHKGVLPEDPKTHLTFHLDRNNIDKLPYSQTLDEKPVIDWIEQDDGTLIHDEIVIRVTTDPFWDETEKIGGPRGDTFTYASAQYGAVAIENLTHPDRKFEYE